MKQALTIMMATMAVAFSASIALAASYDLTNGSIGQSVADPAQFGVSVCNGGSAEVTATVPVSVSGNGQSVSVSSAAPIPAGQCAYTYVDYAALAMQANHSYNVSITIDPNKTVVSNTSTQASYTVSVPAQPVAAATQATVAVGAQTSTNSNTDLTANVAENAPTNIFAAIWGWFIGLFKAL